jgi:osmotically-inducible protein OsmY
MAADEAEKGADRAISAEEIVDDVDHVLGHSWFFDPQTISVAQSGAVVTLKGTVRSAKERRMAAAAAWAVDGVTDVRNELTITTGK